MYFQVDHVKVGILHCGWGFNIDKGITFVPMLFPYFKGIYFTLFHLICSSHMDLQLVINKIYFSLRHGSYHKSETFDKFQQYHARVQKQLGLLVKTFRLDRCMEYLSNELLVYLVENRILSQLIVPELHDKILWQIEGIEPCYTRFI